ncbi:MAG: hypothetical protein GX661_06650 [Acholeplasmataceae bacterium]|nr:hypothetical protein [Acholeplasmataceae bacterium]
MHEQNDFNQTEPEKELPKVQDHDYHIGDKVVHNKFGDGIIIAIDGETGQIFFDQEKRLTKILLNHPALRKK